MTAAIFSSWEIVSLHGCFLRGSSWAIPMSISACASALGWQTKYWGTSSVIAEAKFHSSCDNYLKKGILAFHVQQLKVHTTLWRFFLNKNWPKPWFYLFFVTHVAAVSIAFPICILGQKVGCSQSKLGQTDARLQSTRPSKEGCMKQVCAEGEQELCFPSGRAQWGALKTLFQTKSMSHMPLTWGSVGVSNWTSSVLKPHCGFVGNTWILSVTFIQDYSDNAFKVRI